jgi:hypothetical protein
MAEDIVKSEKCALRIALVNYRDHPPQENTYITQINDFTDDMVLAKLYVTQTQASGGGDGPESVCCGLNDCFEKLKWRDEAIKIAILIADAPPHGLGCWGDGFPNGCPKKVDPVEACHKLAAKGITLYVAGCEPALTPYRQFFIAMSLITGGFYVPFSKAEQLTNVIVGGARCEVSMEKMMAQVHEEVMKEAAEKGTTVNEDELTKRIHTLLNSRKENSVTKIENCDEIEITEEVIELSKLKTLVEVVDTAKIKGINLTTYASKFPITPVYKTKCIAFTPVRSKKTLAIKKKRAMPKKSKTIAVTVSTICKKSKLLPHLLGLYELNGIRRSYRLVKTLVDTPSVAKRGTTKRTLNTDDTKAMPAKKLKSTIDENINVNDVRRLVKKAIARNKLSS